MNYNRLRRRLERRGEYYLSQLYTNKPYFMIERISLDYFDEGSVYEPLVTIEGRYGHCDADDKPVQTQFSYSVLFKRMSADAIVAAILAATASV